LEINKFKIKTHIHLVYAILFIFQLVTADQGNTHPIVEA